MTTDKIISNIKQEIMSVKTVEEYMELPRAERREAFQKLSPELKKKARVASEKRRGIAFRTQDGDIIFTKDALKAQILRLDAKRLDMPRRAKVLAERVVELKNQATDVYGDDFIAEVEGALEASQK